MIRMTICDKINDVGETLQENLNNRGVDCTFGTGTNESTVLEMVEMVNGTNFKGSSDVNLKIGANRPYLLENETTDVVVKLENGLCEPLKNKSVTVSDGTNTVNGVTDEKGEFALYNISVTDNTTFTASYGTETATTNVYLCEFIDYATTSNHNDHYTNLSSQYIHLTRTDGGTTLTSDYTGTGTINMGVADSSNTVINFDLDSSSYMVEMDLLDSQGKSSLQITKSGDNANNYDSYNYKDKAPCKVRIKVTKTRNEFYVDDTRVTARDTTNNRFNLIIPVNSTAYNMKFRNLRVYKI